ncbi:MAG: DUF2306 domain-containing protein [Acidobacteriia bacterium]|nr:DUF2306 domain-containing protein [Terriglobia bacterium]
MATAAPNSMTRSTFLQAKHVFWTLFALMTLLVLLTRERMLLDAHSFLRQRYAPIPWLMLAHGVPGALALSLGVFQFSTRFRQRHQQLHRVMGRVYVACAIISAPVAVAVAVALPLPTLLSATVIQAFGWLVTIATALYCVRTGRIQQHREWMMRSYPFAAMFVIVRVILLIPAIERTGPLGIASVVWSVLAVSCFLPSFFIAWKSLASTRRRPA